MTDKTTNLNKALLRSCFVLPLLWFAAYIGLVLIGGLAAMYGASDKFYCTVYCKLGVWILIIGTGVFVAYQTAKYIRSCKGAES